MKQTGSGGGRLVGPGGRDLLLDEMRVDSVVLGGICRTSLSQHFINPYEQPLDLTLNVPLPADGAVAGFSFQLGTRRLVGRVEPRSAARAAYERAILEGRSAALLEEERSSVFTQTIGNVPAHTDVLVEIDVEHPLAWLGDGSWEWRFPTTLAPRYLGLAGRVEDADAITVDVVEGGQGPNVSVRLRFDEASAPATLRSPSHAIRVSDDRTEAIVEGALPDRDLVVHWRGASASPGVDLVVARPADDDVAYGVLTLVPPLPGVLPARSRHIVVVIDASGSTYGGPISQAKEVVRRLVALLGEEDALELVAFADQSLRWLAPVGDTPEVRQAGAQAWLEEIEAAGATEMTEALAGVLGSPSGDTRGRHVVLVTDGLVGFEDEVIAIVRRSVSESDVRVHCVGIGPAPNRTLTSGVARVGRGIEVVIGLEDDPERVAGRLLAGMGTPVVGDILVGGSAVVELAARYIPDLLGSRPTRIPLRLKADGGEIVVSGRMGEGYFRAAVTADACAPGSGDQAIVRAFGRERVEAIDLGEISVADGDGGRTIEEIGCRFQIATCRTSWVVMTDEQMVGPDEPTRRERVPSMLPAGLSAEGLGLRPAAASGEIAATEGAFRMASTSKGRMYSRLPSGEEVEPGYRHASSWTRLLLIVLACAALVAIVVARPQIRDFLHTLMEHGQSAHENPAEQAEAP